MSKRLKRLLFICLYYCGVNCKFNLTISLCTSKGPNGIAEHSAGKKGALYIRMGHSRYIPIKNQYSVDDDTLYPNTIEYPGSLLRSNQIELQYRDRDIMCLEQLIVTEGNYRIDLLQDWDKYAFNLESYPYRKGKKAPWESQTGRKITLWADSCAPDSRLLTQIDPYLSKCHNHLFLQHDHVRSGRRCNTKQVRTTCGPNADCADTMRGHKCVCHDGYKMNKKSKECTDVNECANRTLNKCMGLAQCINTLGSYECRCRPGFQGEYCSNDVDECKAYDKVCAGTNGYCVNTFGSYNCKCPNGLKKVGDKCIDINECELEQHNCWEGGVCQNTWGSFKCRCPAGFEGDGYQCHDYNECKNGNHGCHDLATCHNTLGAYTCSCLEHARGNGTYCEDDASLLARGHRLPPENGVICGINSFYRPWVSAREECSDPSCDATIDIINAWETNIPRINKRAASIYGEFKHWWGFSAVITIPLEDVFSDSGFTILLRFSESVERGSFQVYNLQVVNYFNDDGGYDLLLQPKIDSSIVRRDGQIKANQFQIVADRLQSDSFPSILYWNSTMPTHCFGREQEENENRMGKLMFDKKGRIFGHDNIRKIVLKEEEIKRIARL